MTDLAPFELGDPLPSGRVAVEASAGTGKTYALATLAARFVAEQDVAIGELLIVTFTRAAAAELRDRVRARLVELAELLRDPTLTPPPELEATVGEDRERRLHRVETAIADFDAATITTIHGYAQQVLGSLGSTVPTDPDAVLTDDTEALISQVAADLLAAEAVVEAHDPDLVPGHAELVTAARLALGNPDAHLLPDPDPEASTAKAALRRALVDRIATEVTHRRRVSGSLAFDDLLVDLRDALCDPTTGAAACLLMRRRYRVALIDEFQDTDPVQWDVFDALFGREDQVDAEGRPTTLILVGDPKQAIYGFRGADVHTYLDAAHDDGTSLSGLPTNWRSDGPALDALEVLLEGATFGDDRIRFQHVEAAEANRDRRMTTAAGEPLPTLSLRLTVGPDLPRGKNKPHYVLVDHGKEAVQADLANHIRDLLETARIPDEHRPGEHRPLRPDDIAVLISAGREGTEIRKALEKVDVPAVIARGDNVLDSDAAGQWHLLLAALARPADARRARAVALSWFKGWDGARLDAAGDDDIAELQEQLHRWGAVLTEHGLAAFIGALRADTGVAARVLRRPDGDRAMTDLDHIAELLQLAAPPRLTPAMLLGTFEQLAGGVDDDDPETDLAARRVESEARAVQIMTTYVAKGLEFPVVCCPSLWAGYPVAGGVPPVHWDHGAHRRAIDLAKSEAWPDKAEASGRREQEFLEAVGSNLRVLYVAATRAKHHTALWWVRAQHAEKTGLARVLFARDDAGALDADRFAAARVALPSDDEAAAFLDPLLERAGDALEVVTVDAPVGTPGRWSGRAGPDRAALSVAALDRTPDRARGRWSFTALTARAHEAGTEAIDPLDDTVGDAGDADEQLPPDAPETAAATTEPAVEPATEPDDGGTGAELPLGDIAGGAGFGTLVHEVLERVDFTAADLEATLADAVAERLAWNPWPVDVGRLVDGLAAVIRTPLGPRFADRPLSALAPADRLDELDFDLALGEQGSRATDAQVGALLLDHLPADDPLVPWATRIAAGRFHATLAGHLTGSIDLVARVRTDTGPDRFVTVDYKTNRLAPGGQVPTMALFRPDRLTDAMAGHDYPLQALLYAVALHRYLRWRLPAYDPEVHLGGVGYLFVRGLIGPDTPTIDDGTPHGVWSWQPPSGLVPALSDLLDGAGRRAPTSTEVAS